MSEKAVAIGTYVVCSGIDTYLGVMPPVTGSSKAVELLCGGLKDKVGACFHVNEDPVTLAKMIMDDIEAKRSHFEELYQENIELLQTIEDIERLIKHLYDQKKNKC